MKNKKTDIRKLCTVAIMGALGTLLMLIEFPIPALIPPFIKLDFSELPALLATFAFGPGAGISVCLIKNLLHLFAGSSMGIGELSNFILGAVFTGIAGLIYKKHHNRKAALIACITGAAAMAVICIFTNYFIIYPLYIRVLGMTNEAIVGMYAAIFPGATSLFTALVIFNLPFTLIKGLIDTALCFAVYKPLSPLLKGKK